MDSGAKALFAAVAHLLRPLVKILLQHGVGYDRFAAVVRAVYVDVAERDFSIPGRKQTVSRVSVLTGLTRKEVVRLKAEPPLSDNEEAMAYNRAARVVTGWLRDYPMDGTPSGAAPLPLDGEKSFATLVKRYSGDMPVRAVLDELIRVDAVRKSDSVFELTHRHYIPPPGEAKKLVYLGDDVADLISTIGHNLTAPQDKAHFQRKTFADNVPLEHLEQLRALVHKNGTQLIDEMNREFAKHDRDADPSVLGSGRMRAVIGVYYAESEYAEREEPMPRPKRRHLRGDGEDSSELN